MNLCLLDPVDPSAPWLAAAVPDMAILTSDDLLANVTIEHHQREGLTSTTLRTSGGGVVEVAGLERVCCRLTGLTPFGMGYDDEDLAYASAEWGALLISWLHELAERVVNKPVPHGLAGEWCSAQEWTRRAQVCGLRAVLDAESAQTSGGLRCHGDDEAVVIGRRVFSHLPLPSAVVDALVDLAHLSGTGTLGVSSVSGLGAPVIVGLTGRPTPHLAATGPAGQTAFRTLMTGSPGSDGDHR